MLPALNIPTLISPLCPNLPHTFPSATGMQQHEWYHLPSGLFNNTFPFTVSLPLPLPLPFTLSILSRCPCPFPIRCSRPFRSPFLTTLGALLTLAIFIVIAIARTAPPTAPLTGICPVLIMIILVDYLMPIQWSNGQEVAWLVQPPAGQLNCSPEIIATLTRETLASTGNLPWAGCLRIGVIDLFPEGTGVVPPPIVHLVVGYVNHLPHVWAWGWPPLPKRWTPAPAVRPHQLDLWKVATHDCIKKDYIIKVVQWALTRDAATIINPYESTTVFWDESLYTVPIQQQVSIYNLCLHFCPGSCLLLSFVVSLWCHRCKLKPNLHPRR